jgi:2-polyprenyl-6-methoxyphenol hydroxylase-like FAD-dependent oxidoreductase
MNKSLWLNFKVVTNWRWSHANVVLIGDALRTVHFSVGSGARMALEDAIILAQAFAAHKDVGMALREFERVRRPTVEQFLQVAAHSSRWYEHMRTKFPLAPLPFAYDYLMRSGTISHARLQERSPKFVAAYEVYVATARAAHGQTSHVGDNVC